MRGGRKGICLCVSGTSEGRGDRKVVGRKGFCRIVYVGLFLTIGNTRLGEENNLIEENHKK
jgi:hypothetical protein